VLLVRSIAGKLIRLMLTSIGRNVMF
jgi:hypothetical protein